MMVLLTDNTVVLLYVQLIPEDYEYSSVNGDAFVPVESDQSQQIKEGSEVRIKVVGVRADTQDMVSAETPLDMLSYADSMKVLQAEIAYKDARGCYAVPAAHCAS